MAPSIYSPRGSLWHRWDLHFHTPSSYDYADKSVTDQDIVESLVKAGLSAVAVTDHHTIDVRRVRELQALSQGKLTVFPGIELRSELGGKETVHFIGIFPEDCDLDDVWTKLSAGLRITASDLKAKGDGNIYCDFAESAALIHELGGLVTVHGHGKASSIEGIANYPAFKAQLKTDLLQNHVDILEVGKEERQADYRETVFPAIGFELPLILGSDNHNVRKYAPSSPCWLRADATFKGLQMVVYEPTDRVFIGDVPPDIVRLKSNKTKYIDAVSFKRLGPENPAHRWFSGTVLFNPGLVAIIGNKGSGKSALADALGLVAGTRNGASFSFLNRDRFCPPVDR